MVNQFPTPQATFQDTETGTEFTIPVTQDAYTQGLILAHEYLTGRTLKHSALRLFLIKTLTYAAIVAAIILLFPLVPALNEEGLTRFTIIRARHNFLFMPWRLCLEMFLIGVCCIAVLSLRYPSRVRKHLAKTGQTLHPLPPQTHPEDLPPSTIPLVLQFTSNGLTTLQSNTTHFSLWSNISTWKITENALYIQTSSHFIYIPSRVTSPDIHTRLIALLQTYAPQAQNRSLKEFNAQKVLNPQSHATTSSP